MPTRRGAQQNEISDSVSRFRNSAILLMSENKMLNFDFVDESLMDCAVKAHLMPDWDSKATISTILFFKLSNQDIIPFH